MVLPVMLLLATAPVVVSSAPVAKVPLEVTICGPAFEAGWTEGWNVAFSERGLFPEFAPFPPFPPLNGDTYAVGYRMGYLAGLRRIAAR